MASALLSVPPALVAADPRDPGEGARGKVLEWTYPGGPAFQYYIPAGHREGDAVNLTLILHGSNLDRRWGFANHRPGKFRPDDLVVCPDGTTANGRGGFNFLGRADDVARLEAVVKALKAAFKVRATFIYGHSQGSFFAFHFAAAKPDQVQGVVGHASGVWRATRLGKEAHHQAVCLMHGTRDPVVPYGQSVGGLGAFEKAGYPLVRMRSLEGWNHWPAEHNGPVPHTSQQLAWAEGMTSADPGRLAAALETLAEVSDPGQHDFAGLYAVAQRVAGLDAAPDRLGRRAAAIAEAVNALAASHAEDLRGLPDSPGVEDLEDGLRLGMFLRAFAGVPAREGLAERKKRALERHDEAAAEHLKAYYPAARGGKRAAAARAAAGAIREGFLSYRTLDPALVPALTEAADDARKIGLERKEARDFGRLAKDFKDAQEAAMAELEKVNRRGARFR